MADATDRPPAPTPAETERIVETAEREAWADLYRAVPAGLSVQYGLAVDTIGSALVLSSRGFDLPLFNRVLGLGLSRPATEAEVDGILALYRARGISRVYFQPSPGARPPQLIDWLLNRGLKRKRGWAKMVRATEPPPKVESDLRITEADADHADIYGITACAGFGMPESLAPWNSTMVGRRGWRTYMAWDDGRPVATGALFIHDRIAWFGNAATLPTYRRRGAQGALMVRRIEDALAAGCLWMATETGEELPENPNPSFHNMLRAGFRPAYLRENYGF